MSNHEPQQDPVMDQSIGRPGPWVEGRGQANGKAVLESVVRKPKEAPPDMTSTQVTLRDYEFGK